MGPLDNLRPIIRLSVENPTSTTGSVFGPGIAALCRRVKSTGSLNAAAKEMHMAYSKAWRIMKETEAALGTQLLDRDGAHGSTLTSDCAELLDIYNSLEVTLAEAAQKAYKDLLK
jgi:molybdate transport system regulatory protein